MSQAAGNFSYQRLKTTDQSCSSIFLLPDAKIWRVTRLDASTTRGNTDGNTNYNIHTNGAIITMNEHEYNHPHYIHTPFFILQDRNLDFFNKYLFSMLWNFATSGKKITMSNGYIASVFNIDITYAGKRLKQLEDMGYIRRVTKGFKRVIEVLPRPYDDLDEESNSNDIKPEINNNPEIIPPPPTGVPPLRLQAYPPPPTGVPYIKAYTKEDIKEKPTPEKIAPAKAESDKSFLMTLEDTLKDNPYNIPSQMLAEWLLIRKKRKCPLTHTAWTRTLKVLTQLVNSGLDAIDCFERMVANGWQGMEVRYFEQELKSTTATSKADLDKEIRQRELKAQEQKRQEFEASKGFVKNITSHMGYAESSRLATEERTRLGMTALEYHNYTQQQHKLKTMTG